MGVADFLALLTIEDVSLGDMLVAAAGKHRFNAVLNILNGDLAVLDLRQEIR